MVRSRVRNALKYPDSDDDLPPHMDEEEQEALLTLLRQTDSSTNDLYSSLFSLLFVLPALHSLLLLLSSPSLIRFLALSSFCMTIYIIKFIPVASSTPEPEGSSVREMDVPVPVSSGGPIDRLLPVLNGVLAAVVALGAYIENSRSTGGPLRWGRGTTLEGLSGYLPIVVYIMSVIVRYVMTPLDLGELEKMRYKYKGA